MSRGFVATLGGIALTLLAWFGSWVWPGWPASLALDALGHYSAFPDLPRAAKVAVVVGLIVINVGTWAVVIRALMQLLPGRRSLIRR
jgi:hypothetical protein